MSSSTDDGATEDSGYVSIDTIKFCQRLELATGQDKAGRSMAYVASNGNIFPNSNAMSNNEYCAGNIQDQGFTDVWHNGFDAYRKITFESFSACATCPVAANDIWCQFRCPSLSRNINHHPTICGATDYLKKFMVLCDNYWKQRESEGMRLRL